MKPIPLSQLAAEARLKGAKANVELNTTPVSPGIVPTTVAEHRQLQRMKSFGTNNTGTTGFSGISSSNTPSSTNGSGSQQAILTATGGGNTPRLNPSRPSISSVSSGQFNFTNQQQSSLTPQPTTTASSATTTTKPRPAGARDIFSRASLAQQSNYLPSATNYTPQNKHLQQSLDDQKENEAMGDDTNTRTSNIAHDGLVKPSALFNRNGNNNNLNEQTC
eukprot:UN02492